ncbi:Major Facilitator Superfamily protein [Micromonospora sp. MW-13]|uniref:MFS transporter n=1 Tax=Micromonospora sp. MW-13 TaxID=2094022 RepID=UPI000E4504AB|nr:MFS transporter [Micromonospora sp. MW-13]RGC65392.1 Major Facilitator Superfamily protein [Micromonospora sp. MW-13]
MYITANRPPGRALLRSVPANVLALGMVSMVTDISAEMVTAVLPLYLVLALGLNPLQVGVLDGLHFGVTALVRLAGAHASDRWRHRKLVAASGYGISALAKLGLLLAGTSVGALGAVITADRAGKGLRTAPRDAMISLSTPPDRLGQAFGVHRAMDTLGAFLGPLAAFGVLAATGGSYDAVFMTSFCVAALGLVLLALYVRDPRTTLAAEPPRIGTAVRAIAGDPAFRRICAVTVLLSLVTVSDFFVYLLLQKQLAMTPGLFPLLPLGTAAVYLLLAVPLGRLADRRGRVGVFLGGHVALLAAYLLLAGAATGIALLIAVLVLHGTFYAATDGVLMSAAGPLLPEALCTSGMAVLQTAQALARLGSSVAFGALWTAWDARTGLLVMAGGLALSLLAARKVIL